MPRLKDLARWRTWKGRYDRFKGSGLTVAAFCRREGVSAASFYQWGKKLRGAQRSGSERARSETFVPVRIMQPATVELRLPNGAQLFLPAGDTALVATAIEAAARIAGTEDQAC